MKCKTYSRIKNNACYADEKSLFIITTQITILLVDIVLFVDPARSCLVLVTCALSSFGCIIRYISLRRCRGKYYLILSGDLCHFPATICAILISGSSKRVSRENSVSRIYKLSKGYQSPWKWMCSYCLT